MNSGTLTTVFIFDIDGVLLENHGYRAAFHETLQHFLSGAGVAKWKPNAYEAGAFFESVGVTCEWDMTPIMLAVALESLLQQFPTPEKYQTIQELQEHFRRLHHDYELDLLAEIEKLRPYLGKYKLAATHLLDLAANTSEMNFPGFQLLKKRSALKTLFGDTRNVDTNPLTRRIQNRVIGSDRFQEVYRQPADFACMSALEEKDTVNLSEELHNRLHNLWQNGELGISLMTARPTYPPHGLDQDRLGYSPEGEIGAKLLNMEEYPLIGYGRLTYFAQNKGIHPEEIMKPAPFQAIAAIHAAIFMDEVLSMQFAWDVNTNAKISVDFPPKLEVHIFEDSSVGIMACKQAVNMLQKYGMTIKLHLWGISQHAQKSAALQKTGAAVFEDINAALVTVIN